MLFISGHVLGQQNRLLSMSDYTYDYIKRLQNRGMMLDLNPTALPYSYGEIKSALDKINENKLSENEVVWFEMIRARVDQNDPSEKNELGLELTVASRVSDTKRQDVLRPLNQKLYAYPYPTLSGYMEQGDFVGQFSIRHDYYYDQDPDGLDAVRRLHIRSEESYAGYQNNNFRITLGRFQNQWGKYGEPSAVMSTNARSFDQINISMKGKHFSLRSILGELDGITADGNFTGDPYREGSKNRFIATHRFDWRPSKYFGISFFESVIYSGNNSGISLKYANPFLIFGFVTDNYPKNDEHNLLIGGMVWGFYQNLSYNMQFMLDDFEHTEDFGEPITFTYLTSLTYALNNPSIDLNLEFEAVAYQTYNTHQAEGRYLYLGRSMATPTNDYIKLRLTPDFYLDQYLRGLKVSPYLAYYVQGEQVINQEFNRRYPDGSVIDVILTGNEEKTIRGGLHVLYQPRSYLWFELDTGYNNFQNRSHVQGQSDSRFVTIFKAGVRFGLYGGN
ncbi:capsule assembly Wzi family protein [Gracilimonas sp.]|uniref:capsule assembly Wzi family protein n=1 Tax=Gracilimonas sp. TaxID=1974203 RepID=UPI002871F2FE|nr:capsule assembly Wzi family protein [Gracilimonas sp.]